MDDYSCSPIRSPTHFPHPSRLSRRRAHGVVLIVGIRLFSTVSIPSIVITLLCWLPSGWPHLAELSPFTRRFRLPTPRIYSSGHRATLLSRLNYVLRLDSTSQTISRSTVVTSRLPHGPCEERMRPARVAWHAQRQRPLGEQATIALALGTEPTASAMPSHPSSLHLVVRMLLFFFSAYKQYSSRRSRSPHCLSFPRSLGHQRRLHDERQPWGCSENITSGGLSYFQRPGYQDNAVSPTFL